MLTCKHFPFCHFPQEDDIRITADHVINFLQLSSDIKQLHDKALSNDDHHAHVDDESPPRSQRHVPNDGSSFGNDVVDDRECEAIVPRIITC